MPTRISLVNTVDPKTIRVEQIEGEPHLVIPSYTLPDNVVMNGLLYPKAVIDAAWQTIENTLAPIGHPTNGAGDWLPAGHPDAIHNFHGGAYNRNARRDGHRVYVEKVVNIRYALQTEPGRRLLNAVRYNAETGEVVGPEQPIHTSTGLTATLLPAPEGAPYQQIVSSMTLDHDAILLDQQGAATPEQGVGLMVNVGAGSSNNVRTALERAVWDTLGTNAWVRDHDTSSVIVRMPAGGHAEYGYTLTADGVAELTGAPIPVQEQINWIRRMIQKMLPVPQQVKQPQPEEASMPLSADDLQAIGNLLKPITDQLAELETRTTELQTNSQALAAQFAGERKARADADRALVVEKHGETIANALSPEKLTEIANALRAGNGGQSLPAGATVTNADDGAGWGYCPADAKKGV